VTGITITPKTVDPTATITVNGTTVTSGSASGNIALNVGSNVINTTVTAQDGITSITYSITITRAASTNAKLLSLVTNHGGLTPVFNNSITSYTRAVANSVTSITFTPTVVDKTATITINDSTTISGTPSAGIPLAVGDNMVNITVTAQDGKTTITYTVTVTRAQGSMNTVYQPASVTKPADKPIFNDNTLFVHTGISPNGDGINDFLIIDGIPAYPDNRLQIMNRNGTLIFEAKGYDNSTKVFDGHSNKNGQMQLPGTYFYSLDYTVNGVSKHRTGFIILKY
jgi:gliding motility-associated-like protein